MQPAQALQERILIFTLFMLARWRRDYVCKNLIRSTVSNITLMNNNCSIHIFVWRGCSPLWPSGENLIQSILIWWEFQQGWVIISVVHSCKTSFLSPVAVIIITGVQIFQNIFIPELFLHMMGIKYFTKWNALTWRIGANEGKLSKHKRIQQDLYE